MIIEKKFFNKLKDFGLNSYEAKIWTALLSRGIATAGELSEISNVPRSRSYDVLESLEKKGFIIMKMDKPIKYLAVPPEEVIERVKKRTMEDAEKQMQVIDTLRESEVLEELKRIHSQGVDVLEPMELSAYLKSRYHYYNQIDSMIKNATESVLIVTTEDGLVRKANDLKRAFSKASKRGVKIRILAPVTSKNKEAAESLKRFATVRHFDNIKTRLCLVDSKEAVFALMKEADEAYDAAVWVKSPFFTAALASLYGNIWKESAEIKPEQLA